MHFLEKQSINIHVTLSGACSNSNTEWLLTRKRSLTVVDDRSEGTGLGMCN